MKFGTQYKVVDEDRTVHGDDHELSMFPQGTAYTHHPLDKPSEYDQAGGNRLRRFHLRALIGILGPLIVCGYSIAIWRLYLAPADPSSPLAFGLPGATWIFYSWFIAGLIGLNLSLYGLAGVEAALLMEPAWNVGDATRLMMHADNTWSGPGGWMKTVKWIIGLRGGGRGKLPSRLWCVLALPSILVFLAWPLSGLTMEVTQGHLHGTRNGSLVPLTGFSYDVFNERNVGDAFNGAEITWKNALSATVPRAGIVYTPEGFDRSRSTFLHDLPTVFPKNDGISKMFLAAQADNPTEGTNWGLLLQYNCSIINKLEDFQILNHRNASQGSTLGSYGQTRYTPGNESTEIMIMNQTNSKFVSNLYAVAEVGYDVWPNKTALSRLNSDDYDASFTKTTDCYFNEVENYTGDYPGIDQEQTLEVVLWQKLLNTSYGDANDTAHAPQYNLSIDHNMTDLYGAYNWKDFFVDYFQFNNSQSSDLPLEPMTAIGVQCKASSSVGTADINGVKSTYSNFQRTDTPISVQTRRCASRFNALVPWSILQNTLVPQQPSELDWLSSLFSSSAAPPPFYASYVSDPSNLDANTGYLVQLQHLQAEQLRQSMLHGYASYAVQLMYNGGQGFTARDGSHLTFGNPNITQFVAGTVLKRGVMPAAIPATLFCIWALIASALGAVYGFRRRWSEILDGHTMFRLGAELPDDVRRELGKYSNIMEVEECVALDGIPGFVGDAKPEMWLGRIGLVQGSVADKRKLYE